MLSIIEKIKNIVSSKFEYKPKKKEKSKPQQEELKAKEKPEEQ